MSETDKGFTKVTPGRGTKTNIVTPETKHPSEIPRFLQSETTARQPLFQDPSTEDWTDLTMGPNSQLLQLQTPMPERKPFSQPTTKDVITFKRELITALTKCLTQNQDRDMPTSWRQRRNARPGPARGTHKLRLQLDLLCPGTARIVTCRRLLIWTTVHS